MNFELFDYLILSVKAPDNRTTLIYNNITTLNVIGKNLSELNYKAYHKSIFCWGNNINNIYLTEFINNINNDNLTIEFF